MTLTEFLLARIAEDEAEAEAWPIEGAWGLHSPGQMWTDAHGRPIYAPRARALAECEAKRAVITTHAMYGPEDCEVTFAFLTAFAAVYADHPDYAFGSDTPTDATESTA